LESDIDFNNSLIAQREEEFLEINEAVGEVNAIYRDIAMLVNEQGAMIGNLGCFVTEFFAHYRFCIDTIESQVEDSRDATKKGVGELQSAGKHAKGSGNRLWCILFIVVLVLAAILLYLFVLKQ
jgi:syntaxin 7